MPYITFIKPINASEKIEKVTTSINRYSFMIDAASTFLKAAEKFNGKKITKNMINYLNKYFTAYNFSLRHIAGMIHITISEFHHSESFLISYDTEYFSENFLKYNSIETWITEKNKLVKGIDKIPEFSARYNKLLSEAKLLCEDSIPYGLEYIFDLANKS